MGSSHQFFSYDILGTATFVLFAMVMIGIRGTFLRWTIDWEEKLKFQRFTTFGTSAGSQNKTPMVMFYGLSTMLSVFASGVYILDVTPSMGWDVLAAVGKVFFTWQALLLLIVFNIAFVFVEHWLEMRRPHKNYFYALISEASWWMMTSIAANIAR